jgi:DNA repair ATPase RecN
MRRELDTAVENLESTQAALRAATERLDQADRRKRKWEKAICHQLTETRAVLRQTKQNLQSCNGSETNT